MSGPLALLTDTCGEWWADNALRLGAALAYYAVFSLAPLLIVAIAISGLVFEHQEAHSQIVAEIGTLIGREGADAISGMLENALAPGSGLLASALSIAIILIGASGAFAELRQGLNDIWKVPRPADSGVLAAIRERSASFFMVLGVGFLFLVSLILNAVVAALDRWFTDYATFNLLKPMQLFISAGMGTLSFAVIFKYVPENRILYPPCPDDTRLPPAASELKTMRVDPRA